MRKLYKSIISVCIALIFFFNANAQSPAVTINQAAGQADPANSVPINFTATFSMAVFGFTSSDVTLSGTAGATTAMVTEIAPNNGTTYNVAVSGMTTSGTVIASIPFNAALAVFGALPNSASTSSDNSVTYDLQPCNITCPQNIIASATSLSGAIVNYTVSNIGDCGTITSIPASGSTFPIGTTTVSAYKNLSQKAYILFGNNNLASFDVTNPSVVSSPVSISQNGIDVIAFRPSNGKLYGMIFTHDAFGSGTSGLYIIDVNTGTASLVGQATFTLFDYFSSMDFDPVTDQIRIVTGTGSSFKFNPDDGSYVGFFGQLSPKAEIAQPSGTAYSNNYVGASSTTLYHINSLYDRLYRIGGLNGDPSPDNGILTAIGPVGFDFGIGENFDISQTGVGYAKLVVGGVEGLYTINLQTGGATLVGTIGVRGIIDMALAPLTILPSCSFTVTVNPPLPPPTVTINQASDQSDPTFGSPVHFTVTFDQAVTGFTNSDITLVGNPPAMFITPSVTVTGGPAVYDVAVSGMQSSGTLSAAIPSNVALNASNQSNLASTSTDNSVVYNFPPCSLTCPSNITVDATSPSGAVVNYTVTPDGDCQSIVRIPASGTTFPVGTTTVYSYGNISSKVYGLTFSNSLITFDKSTPGITTVPLLITGLQAGEVIMAIDFRPSHGQLYGLAVSAAGTMGRLYTINTVTGAATPVGASAFALSIGGNFSIDFNPVADQIRLVSSLGLNLRLNPDLGTVVATDATLNPAGIGLSSIAYSNNFSEAAATTLYGIGVYSSALYMQGGLNGSVSPNTGTLTTVGSLGVNVNTVRGFDISQGAAYAAINVTGSSTPGFYSINPSNGAINLIGSIGNANIQDIALTVSQGACSFTVTVNPPSLTVTINKAATQPDATTSVPVKFTVVFSEDVTGFDASDISFTGSTVPGTLLAIISGTGSTYGVSVSGITGAGNVVASVVAEAAVNNGGQLSQASTSTDNSVQVIVIPHDLFIIKTVQSPYINAGGVITYVVSIIRSPSPVGPVLFNVNVTDVLPVGTRFVGIQTLPSTTVLPISTFPPPNQNGTLNLLFPIFHTSQSYTFLLRVAVDAGATGSISNTATVGGPLGDVNLVNNSATAVVEIAVPPTIICPANITVATRNTDCVGIVDLGNLAFTISGNPDPTLRVSFRQQDNPLVIPVDIGVTPGTYTPMAFVIGTSTVTATASNGFTPNATCQFTVTVVDQTPPIITCPANVSVNADDGACTAIITNAVIGIASAQDNCSGTITPTHSALPQNNAFPIGTTTITWTAQDAAGNTSTCQQTITVLDNVPPVISGVSANPAVLAPPNHKMKEVTINYSVNDCSAVTNVLTVSHNEGNNPSDYEVIDAHHLKLRAERNGTGDGRIYTVTITSTDVAGNSSTAVTTVIVAHNITAPHSGAAFRVGSTVNFAGTFWDVAGNRHTANWLIDDKTSVKAIVTEPSGTKNGTVTGSYKFTTPGVYKLQMNVTDQKGVTTYANTNGDLEAIVVIYDPNGGYTYGGGYFDSPAGALISNSSSTGKASYGFAMNYFKNSTNPKGETQFEFKVSDFEFNALNFDYLVISNSMAQFKGTGKIIGGQSGIGFILTVVDGELDGTGVDKIRMKIYNKTTGTVIYDNQPGASDAALPIQAVGTNSIVVVSGTNSLITSAGKSEQTEMKLKVEEVSSELDMIAFPNPSANNFTISIKGNNKTEKITIQVVDMYGRIIETRNVNANSFIRFGDRYRPGTYLVKIMQGKEHKEIKLIKLSD